MTAKHPDKNACPHNEPAIAVCKKFNQRFCARCFKTGIAGCPRPKESCKDRKDCAVVQMQGLD